VYLVKGQGIRLVQLILLLFVTCEGQQLAIFTPSVCVSGKLLVDCWVTLIAGHPELLLVELCVHLNMVTQQRGITL